MFSLIKKIFIKTLQLFFLKKNKNLIMVGTGYGGMVIVNDESLNNSIVISAGSGEDISFDIELINTFNCKVFLIDPTPRAIEYYNFVSKNFGNKKTTEYEGNGIENPSSYNLEKINNDKLQLIELALHDKNESDIKFYQPPDESHVSYSLTNWRGDYSSKGSFITVKTTTLKNIKEKNKIDHISLLKLDIEGAEINVLKNILNDKIFPKQLAVEFSDLWRDEYKPIIRLSSIFIRLLINGYRLVDISRYPNFLFIRK